MIIKKDMTIKINPQNRKKYEEKLSKTLEKNQLITICQYDLLTTSRLKVECECDFCGKNCFKKRVDIQGEKTFCNAKCRNGHQSKIYKTGLNPNPKKDKVILKCEVCSKEISTNEAKSKSQKYFLCSRECYKIHRTNKYSGENIYNYQDVTVNCEMCNEPVKTSKWYVENKKHIFCTQECYWKHRKVFYKEFYYKDSLNEAREETIPEKIIREWLEDSGIKFKQELPFLRKYYVDFYLPNHKTIIEVYGDYWHVNPDVYDIDGDDSDKKPLNDYQKDLINSQYDVNRENELKSYGYNFIVIWEKDLKSKNVKNILKELSITISNNKNP